MFKLRNNEKNILNNCVLYLVLYLSTKLKKKCFIKIKKTITYIFMFYDFVFTPTQLISKCPKLFSAYVPDFTIISKTLFFCTIEKYCQ